MCYGIDPHINLDCNFYIDNIRNHLKENPIYYQELIKTAFLNNKHKLTIVTKHDEGFIDRINDKIKEDLTEKKDHLNQAQTGHIIKNYDLLKEMQSKPQPIERLPSIKKADIQVVGQYDHITKTEDNVSVLAMPINGMAYVDLVIKVDFAHPLVMYLPLLTSMIGKVGAGEMDDDQMEVFIKKHCSEVRFNIDQKADLDDLSKGCAEITVSAYCLDRNIESMIQKLNMILLQPHLLNQKTVKSLLKPP